MVDQIRFLIASAVLRPGDELPSTRSLSSELRVNPMTISKSYGLLEQQGLLTRRPGLPLIVADLAPHDLDHDRLGRLETVLTPAVLASRQLGVAADNATALFARMLNEFNDRTDQTDQTEKP